MTEKEMRQKRENLYKEVLEKYGEKNVRYASTRGFGITGVQIKNEICTEEVKDWVIKRGDEEGFSTREAPIGWSGFTCIMYLPR